MPNDIFSEPSDPEQTALQTVQETNIQLTGGSFDQLMQKSAYWSKMTMIPATYQGKPENCFIALEFAHRYNVNPMTVMQNLDVIQGKPSWSSKFLTAVANECGRFSPIRYEMSGNEGEDDWGCRAYMTEIATGEVLKGPKVTIKMAKDEGWHGKSGSKWKTMPELMLRYRSATFLIRTYAPELTMGLHTKDEREDIEINVTPRREPSEAEKAWAAKEAETIDV